MYILLKYSTLLGQVNNFKTGTDLDFHTSVQVLMMLARAQPHSYQSRKTEKEGILLMEILGVLAKIFSI